MGRAWTSFGPAQPRPRTPHLHASGISVGPTTIATGPQQCELWGETLADNGIYSIEEGHQLQLWLSLLVVSAAFDLGT